MCEALGSILAPPKKEGEKGKERKGKGGKEREGSSKQERKGWREEERMERINEEKNLGEFAGPSFLFTKYKESILGKLTVN